MMKYIRSLTVLSLLITLAVAAYGQAQDSTVSFLALGDSYTIGENVSPQERWPVQLAEKLGERGLKTDEPQIIAVTGWTTLDLQRALAEAELNPPYDLVSLLIGVNDQYQGLDMEAYPRNFLVLLEKAIELAGDQPDHVLVLSIPDYGATPFGQQRDASEISREIRAYNRINRQVSDSLGVRYVNITPISRQVRAHPRLLAEDGLHPSGIMYGQWVDRIIAEIFPELEKPVDH